MKANLRTITNVLIIGTLALAAWAMVAVLALQLGAVYLVVTAVITEVLS